MTTDALYRDVARGLRAIAPFADRAVVCGGWVPRLYRTMPGFASSERSATMSWDLDVVVPHPLPGEDLGAVFRANELVAVASRDQDPPVVRWQGKEFGNEALAPVHLDLLTPLVGSEIGRGGEDKRLPEVQDGLRASAIRRLDLLLFEPLRCDVSRLMDLGLREPTFVSVPNPLCFIVQKVLSAPTRRDSAKRAKDYAYVYDVIMLSRPFWSDMHDMLERVRDHHGEWARWLKDASSELDRVFSGEGGVATDVARQLATQELAPTPRAVLLAVGAFRRSVGI